MLESIATTAETVQLLGSNIDLAERRPSLQRTRKQIQEDTAFRDKFDLPSDQFEIEREKNLLPRPVKLSSFDVINPKASNVSSMVFQARSYWHPHVCVSCSQANSSRLHFATLLTSKRFHRVCFAITCAVKEFRVGADQIGCQGHQS